MLGTIRTFSEASRADVIERMGRIATNVAEANGATATLELTPAPNPPLVNDPALTERVKRSLERVLGEDAVSTSPMLTIAEDFAHVARAVPSVFWWLGVTPIGTDPATTPDNHSDRFFVDEAGIQVGLRSLLHVAVDFLQAGSIH